MTTLVWLHDDYRLADNPALYEAAQRGPVVPVVLWAPEELGAGAPGGAQRWWLHRSLTAFSERLRAAGAPLVIRRGPSLDALVALLRETGATRVAWNRRETPGLRLRDEQLASALRALGVDVVVTPAALLHDPAAVRTGQGAPYLVFTPFWKRVRAELRVPEPLPVPRFKAMHASVESVPLDALELLPRIHWYDEMERQWEPGEVGAAARLQTFLSGPVGAYREQRDQLAVDGTSRLSPHLHFGEISVRSVWYATVERSASLPASQREHGEFFLRELGWREFCHHVLLHWPRTVKEPLRPAFAAFPWKDDAALLHVWERGRTGYPVVDAAMQELWRTGVMHNRARMIVASFLTKHLLLPWQRGAAWFWDTLLDADVANNTMGWQWAAGCGADAQPFFRIFNPVSQGEKFDADGAYVHRWLPQLAKLPAPHVHAPWNAPPLLLRAAGVELGRTYPRPLVDHATARARALTAFERVKAAVDG